MFIVINLSAFYDWIAMDEVPSKEDIMALRVKPGQDGKWLKKIVKQKETFTEINLPEPTIQEYMNHCEKVGMPKKRERVVAMFLEERIMPHHADVVHWKSINVHDDLVLEKYLNKYFELNEIEEKLL